MPGWPQRVAHEAEGLASDGGLVYQYQGTIDYPRGSPIFDTIEASACANSVDGHLRWRRATGRPATT